MNLTGEVSKFYKYVLIGLGVVIGLYIAFMGAYNATSFPGFCSTCHEIKSYVTSWKQSQHKNINCLNCHEQRGFLGKIDSKTSGLNNAYQHLTGQYSSLIARAETFEQNCIDCHFKGYSKFPKAPVLNEKHYDFVKEGKSCIECHRDTGHEHAIISEKR